MNIIEEYIEIYHDHFKIVNWLRKFDGLNNMAFSCGITVNMGIGDIVSIPPVAVHILMMWIIHQSSLQTIHLPHPAIYILNM
jgi:hypothetical protein